MLLFSCETNNQKKEKCEEVVKSFIANLPIDNYDSLYKQYPDFQHIGGYWKPSSIDIVNTTINDDNTITVVGNSNIGGLLFNLEKVDGKYIIINSKGLSAVLNTPLYKYCKRIGCINVKDYDKEISSKCFNKKKEFEELVNIIKTNIEDNFFLESHNLTNSFGSISGNATMKNNSRFSIPEGSYKIYYHFLASNGTILLTKEEGYNFSPIPFGQSMTRYVYEASSESFDKIKIELKLISTDFIENIIAENIVGNNCNATGGF